MAKERTVDKDAAAELKREKHSKSKKEKRSEKDGVHKSKSVKKDKVKPEKIKAATAADGPEGEEDITMTLLDTLEEGKKPSSSNGIEVPIAKEEEEEKEENGSGGVTVKVKPAPLLGALVPFAHPLADEKVQKKVFKIVKKAAKNKSLKRGVKEVVKSLRKSPTGVTSTTTTTTKSANAGTDAIPLPHGVVVLAADISPMDVISHIPVLCEDHAVPYVFVPSRAELGAAGNTKRPTSVVLVGREAGGKKKKKEKEKSGDGEEKDFEEVYRELVKVVMKASRDVRI